MRYGIIYKIQNKINNKIYIGQTTKSFDERYSNNLYKYTHNKDLKKEILEYGIENFDINKEYYVAKTKEELDNKEDELIKRFKSNNKEYGYNKKTGGDKGLLNEEVKEKIRASKVGEKHPQYGKKRPDISKKMLGENNVMYGKKGQAHPRAQAVICLDDLKKFESLSECAEFYKFNKSNLSEHLKGKRKSCGKRQFMYLNEYKNLTI